MTLNNLFCSLTSMYKFVPTYFGFPIFVTQLLSFNALSLLCLGLTTHIHLWLSLVTFVMTIMSSRYHYYAY